MPCQQSCSASAHWTQRRKQTARLWGVKSEARRNLPSVRSTKYWDWGLSSPAGRFGRQRMLTARSTGSMAEDPGLRTAVEHTAAPLRRSQWRGEIGGFAEAPQVPSGPWAGGVFHAPSALNSKYCPSRPCCGRRTGGSVFKHLCPSEGPGRPLPCIQVASSSVP